jgi:hypothetical protein
MKDIEIIVRAKALMDPDSGCGNLHFGLSYASVTGIDREKLGDITGIAECGMELRPAGDADVYYISPKDLREAFETARRARDDGEVA